MVKANGSFEKVTRQMVIDMKDDISTLKKDVKNLSENLSKRLPQWATLFIGVLMGLVGIMGGRIF